MNLTKITLRNVIASGQPRPLVTAEVDKLAASIKEVGLIQPITVRETVVLHGTAEKGWQIIAGHHRVAACRALGWTEIDAIVIDDASHLQSELMEIDENLCRAELTAPQRAGYTKRRKQIWEALHPETEVAHVAPPQFSGQLGGARPQTQGFASSTAEITGESKATINRHIARADSLGDDALAKVENTSLSSGVELDALAKMPAPERAELIERAAAGEHVSARSPAPITHLKKPSRTLPMELLRAVFGVPRSLGYRDTEQLIEALNDLPELTNQEQKTLDEALDVFLKIGNLKAD
jgi:ParB-like chromosome segregation protein Spo0J